MSLMKVNLSENIKPAASDCLKAVADVQGRLHIVPRPLCVTEEERYRSQVHEAAGNGHRKRCRVRQVESCACRLNRSAQVPGVRFECRLDQFNGAS